MANIQHSNIAHNINIENLRATIAAFEPADVDLVKPLEFEYDLWQAIKDSIKPHIDGVMPLLTEQAFAREQKSQRENRKQLYRSESSYLLAQSIQNVYRIAQSDDFVVDFSGELADILTRTYLGSKRLGKDIIKNIFSVIYIDRVRDANGFIGIVPHNYQNETTGAKSYTLKIYPSENIVLRSRECMVFAIDTNKYRVYTLNSTFIVNGQGELMGVPFMHNSGDLGCYILGGAPRHIELNSGDKRTQLNEVTQICEVQFSDYSFATAKLDKLENRNSQNEVVLNLHVHPRMVARDLTCTTCDGIGQIQAKDANGVVLNRIIDNGTTDEYGGGTYSEPVMHKCPTCDGKKIIDIGTQDVITIPMPSSVDVTEVQPQNITDLAKGVVAYISPDITSAEFLYKQYVETAADCKEMLGLQRFEDFSESGAAKRIDQEAAQPRLRAIAEGLQTLIDSVLRGLVNFEFVAEGLSTKKTNALAQIRVSIPTFFDMLSVAESKENYFANLEKKPLAERAAERINLLKKQDNALVEIAIFKAAYAYTKGANTLLLDEISTNLAIGALTSFEAYVAQFIDAIIRYDILAPAAESLRPLDIAAMSQADIFSRIDTALAPMVAARAAAAASQLAATQALAQLLMDNDSSTDE